MEYKEERLTLATLAGGAAIEAVDGEIERVIANILDPNCDPAKRRGVTLELVFMPTKDNPNMFAVSIQAKSKLVPANAVITTAYADHDASGRVCSAEMMPGIRRDQAALPVENYDTETGEVHEGGEIIDFRKRAGGEK